MKAQAEPLLLRVLQSGEAVAGVELAGETARHPGSGAMAPPSSIR